MCTKCPGRKHKDVYEGEREGLKDSVTGMETLTSWLCIGMQSLIPMWSNPWNFSAESVTATAQVTGFGLALAGKPWNMRYICSSVYLLASAPRSSAWSVSSYPPSQSSGQLHLGHWVPASAQRRGISTDSADISTGDADISTGGADISVDGADVSVDGASLSTVCRTGQSRTGCTSLFCQRKESVNLLGAEDKAISLSITIQASKPRHKLPSSPWINEHWGLPNG